MIDFRYHIVSLIAVFLALSVGIVLGAGPLRDSIGDTLTGQVQDLREDRDQLRVALETAERDVTERTTYLEESAPVLLENTLTDRRVTVVTLPGTVTEDVEELRDRLARAGAEVVGEVAVTEAWTDADTLSFRQTFAGQLLGYMDDAPAEDAGAEAIFGAALAQALTGTGEELSEDAATLVDLLTSAEAPLITLTEEPAGPAHATVLVGPRPAELPTEEEDPEEVEAAAETLAGHVRLADALAQAAPSVTVGAAVSDRDLVTAVRDDEAAAGAATTVDSVGEVTAAISAPLALAVSISGATDAYGFGLGAEAPVPPRVELPLLAPDVTPVEPSQDGTAGAEETTAGEETTAPAEDATTDGEDGAA